MATFLLVWNPNRWEWHDIDDAIQSISQQGWHKERWSCGKNKGIKRGDRVFLIRLGKKPRGIIGSGFVEEGSFEAEHWDEIQAKQGDLSQYVDVRFDTLLNADANEPILHRDILKLDPRLSKMHWDSQMSGIQITDQIAIELELIWQDFIDQPSLDFPEEIQIAQIFHEGTKQTITVNRFERNPKARRECIKHYGAICKICMFDFGKIYGHIGKGFIHVHHLKPLADLNEDYEVDPIVDLIPVCPNCHAMIHRKNPPFTINEVRAYLKKQ